MKEDKIMEKIPLEKRTEMGIKEPGTITYYEEGSQPQPEQPEQPVQNSQPAENSGQRRVVNDNDVEEAQYEEKSQPIERPQNVNKVQQKVQSNIQTEGEIRGKTTNSQYVDEEAFSGNQQEQQVQSEQKRVVVAQAEEEVSSDVDTSTLDKISSGELSLPSEARNSVAVGKDQTIDGNGNIKKRVAQDGGPSQVTGNSFLDSINIDVNEIEIVEKSTLERRNDMNEIFSTKSTFSVTCCQSAFRADMSALSMSDINRLNGSNNDSYNYSNNLFNTVYKHIEKMSIVKPSYSEWLKITSINDFDTLLFGLYSQTFPDTNNFEITCGHCGNNTDVEIDNNSLIKVMDDEVYDKIDEVVNSVKDKVDLVNKSLVNTTKRIILPESKIMVDIRIPSLHNQLTILKSVTDKLLQNYSESIMIMVFIKDIYMLDIEGTRRSGSAKYYKLGNQPKDVLDLLIKLSVNDGKYLEKVISKRSEKHSIAYEINGAVCDKCEEELDSLEVDLRRVLFTRIEKAGQTD